MVKEYGYSNTADSAERFCDRSKRLCTNKPRSLLESDRFMLILFNQRESIADLSTLLLLSNIHFCLAVQFSDNFFLKLAEMLKLIFQLNNNKKIASSCI